MAPSGVATSKCGIPLDCVATCVWNTTTARIETDTLKYQGHKKLGFFHADVPSQALDHVSCHVRHFSRMRLRRSSWKIDNIDLSNNALNRLAPDDANVTFALQNLTAVSAE